MPEQTQSNLLPVKKYFHTLPQQVSDFILKEMQ